VTDSPEPPPVVVPVGAPFNPPVSPAPAEPEGPEPTHDLLLSDGQVIPSSGAIPTLVHIGGDILAVVRAFERRHQP
jgi:hypothetical protein